MFPKNNYFPPRVRGEGCTISGFFCPNNFSSYIPTFFIGIVDKLLLEFERRVLPTETAGKAFMDSFFKKVLYPPPPPL